MEDVGFTRGQVTALIDAWPYSVQEIERAVYSAQNVADRVLVLVPDLISPLDADSLLGIPAEVRRVPFWGSFTTMHNTALDTLTDRWVLFLCGNEELLAADSGRILKTLHGDSPRAYRLIVATGAHGQILAEPVRIFPIAPDVHFVGRIWPQTAGSLIEYGYPTATIEAHLYRLENRASTIEATRLMRNRLMSEAAAEPRNWRFNVALAVVSWAQHRYQEVHERLSFLPRLGPEHAQIVEGLKTRCALDEGVPQRAFEMSQKVISRHPEWTDQWAMGGEALMQLGRWEEAAEFFGQATRGPERHLPHIDPGYATSEARLNRARAEMAAGQRRMGLANLLAILEAYPGYRPAWQEVLGHLRGVPPEEIFAMMETVLMPSKIRQFFALLDRPTPEEERLQNWLQTRQLNY